MGEFNLKTKTITLPIELADKFNNISTINIMPLLMTNHIGIIEHPLGIKKKQNLVYKAQKKSELLKLQTNTATLEFVCYFKNVAILKINKLT